MLYVKVRLREGEVVCGDGNVLYVKVRLGYVTGRGSCGDGKCSIVCGSVVSHKSWPTVRF